MQMRAWTTVHHRRGDLRAEVSMLGRVQQPSAYACALNGNDVVAVSRVVVDAGWAGVFGMATLPRMRAKGAASAALSALADWSTTQGADCMYLQVERDNISALRLYENSGFTEFARYHYRTAAPKNS